MKKTVLAFIVIVLSACVSSADYSSLLDNWVGSSQEVLITSWGDPAEVSYPIPGQELWTYFQTSPSGAEFCRTSFTIVNGTVTDYTFEGDNCE